MSLCNRMVVILGLISLLGCVKDVKDLKDFPGDRSFEKTKQAGVQTEEAVTQAIKERVMEGRTDLRIDPWVPPLSISRSKSFPGRYRLCPKTITDIRTGQQLSEEAC